MTIVLGIAAIALIVLVPIVLAHVTWMFDFRGEWHDAYRCDGCGHTEDDRPRRYSKVCGGCGRTDTTTTHLVRRWNFGWEEKP